MLLPSRVLRVFVCFCFLFVALPNAFSQGTKEDQRKGYEAYVKGLFRQYDADSDGSLSVEEVEKMRRKPDSKVDANSDGEITQAELVEQYLIKAKIKKTGHRKDSDSRFRQKEVKQKLEKLNGTVTLVCNGTTITLLGDAGDVASVESMLQKAVKEAGDSRVAQANERTVELSVWIVNASSSIDMNELKGKSKEFVGAVLAKLEESAAVQVEEFHVDTNLGRSIELSRSGQVPVIRAVSQTRGSQRSNQVSNYEVGTRLNAEATRSGKNVLIAFKIENSTVEDSDVVLTEHDDEIVFAKTVYQNQLEAEVECEPDKACVVNSKKGDRSWTIVFCADAATASSIDDTADSQKTGARKSGSRKHDADSLKRQRRSRD